MVRHAQNPFTSWNVCKSSARRLGAYEPTQPSSNFPVLPNPGLPGFRCLFFESPKNAHLKRVVHSSASHAPGSFRLPPGPPEQPQLHQCLGWSDRPHGTESGRCGDAGGSGTNCLNLQPLGSFEGEPRGGCLSHRP